MSILSENIAACESTLSNLKSQIESYLEAAASTVLTATSINNSIEAETNNVSVTGGLTQENIETIMNAAKVN